MSAPASDWGFLLDENVDRETATRLREHGLRAELVVEVLKPGVDDTERVLPYARSEDLIVVTKDVSDFGALDPTDHEGLILVFDHSLDGRDIAEGIRTIAEAYPERDGLRTMEILDPWVR